MKIKNFSSANLIIKTLIILLSFLCFRQISPAQINIVPIIETNIGGLLGGVENGRFIDAKTTFLRLKGEKKYDVYGLSIQKSFKVGSSIESPSVPCENFYPANFDSELVSGGIAIGENANWNLVPRAVGLIDLNNIIYKNAIAEVLKAQGIITKTINIKQALRVDLEGDGKDEVILTATSYEENIQSNAKKNDYSVIVLRKVVGKTVKNILLTGEVVKKQIKFGAPGKYKLSAIVDLNGDGKMEIVVYASYYEGNWIEVYEIKSDNPAEVKTLRTNCGV